MILAHKHLEQHELFCAKLCQNVDLCMTTLVSGRAGKSFSSEEIYCLSMLLSASEELNIVKPI